MTCVRRFSLSLSLSLSPPRAPVTAPEIKALYFHFGNLASASKGELLINRHDFQQALGMKSSTFVDRLFAVFDENGDGGVNFAEFLSILNILSTKVREGG